MLSITASSLEALILSSGESVLVADFNEEEKHQKENDEKLTDIDFFVAKIAFSHMFTVNDGYLRNLNMVSFMMMIAQEIFSPPPEHS